MKNILGLIFIFFSFFIPSGNAQSNNNDIKLSGYAKDINGEGIRNISFFADNIKLKAQIRKSGAYKVKIPQNAKNIVIYSGSRIIKEINYVGQRKLNIGFEKSISNAQVQTRDKAKSESKYDRFKTIYDLILAKSPGARVVGNSIIINRGTNSFSGSKEPLFIVNGFEVQRIDNITAVEIDSLEILKGPETTAYGIKGGNGVILITLKK